MQDNRTAAKMIKTCIVPGHASNTKTRVVRRQESSGEKTLTWLYHECIKNCYKSVEKLDFLSKHLFHQIMFVIRFISGYYQL